MMSLINSIRNAQIGFDCLNLLGFGRSGILSEWLFKTALIIQHIFSFCSISIPEIFNTGGLVYQSQKRICLTLLVLEL